MPRYSIADLCIADWGAWRGGYQFLLFCYRRRLISLNSRTNTGIKGPMREYYANH